MFLFLIVVEGLPGLVRQETKASMLKGVKVGMKEVESYVLQFVDDIIFICEDSYTNFITIKVILRCYELTYGQKINFHKSKL